MTLGDAVITPFDPYPVRLHQHISMGAPDRGLEAVASQFDQQTERVRKVNRVYEAPVFRAAMLDTALVEAENSLTEHRSRNRKGQMMNRSDIGRRAPWIRYAVFVGEDRDQP